MKKLVIFDLDGTLLNTLADLADSVKHVLADNGFQERTTEQIRSFVGNGIGKLIERSVPDDTSHEQTERVLDDFKKYYALHCEDSTVAYDGIMELLGRLRNSGVMTAVVSNKADFAVQKLCERYFDGVFDICTGECERIQKKPSADGIMYVIRELGADVKDAVYVGDSEVDIMTARNAGMDEILVSWGFRGREFLLEHGAKIIADTPDEIFKIVTEM